MEFEMFNPGTRQFSHRAPIGLMLLNFCMKGLCGHKKFVCKNWQNLPHVIGDVLSDVMGHDIMHNIILMCTRSALHSWVSKILIFSNKTIVKGDTAIFVKPCLFPVTVIQHIWLEPLGLFLHDRKMIKYTIVFSKCNMQHSIKYTVSNTEIIAIMWLSVLVAIATRKYRPMLHF